MAARSGCGFAGGSQVGFGPNLPGAHVPEGDETPQSRGIYIISTSARQPVFARIHLDNKSRQANE
jgi:hypothetical protein